MKISSLPTIIRMERKTFKAGHHTLKSPPPLSEPKPRPIFERADMEVDMVVIKSKPCKESTKVPNMKDVINRKISEVV